MEKKNSHQREELNWKAYWERLDDNQRIFRIEAEDFVDRFEKIIPISEKWRVLDFGCGFGYIARALAPKIKEIYIWDESKNMRSRAKKNVKDRKNVKCPDRIELLEDLKFDLILVNSVVQYMTLEDFLLWFHRWKMMLEKGGRIIISDIMPDKIFPLLDIASLIPFSLRKKFLCQALGEGLRELKVYRKVRKTHPLMRISQKELKLRASEADMKVKFLRKNLTFRQGRFTAVFFN